MNIKIMKLCAFKEITLKNHLWPIPIRINTKSLNCYNTSFFLIQVKRKNCFPNVLIKYKIN